jgi:hypothetical protein
MNQTDRPDDLCTCGHPRVMHGGTACDCGCADCTCEKFVQARQYMVNESTGEILPKEALE